MAIGPKRPGTGDAAAARHAPSRVAGGARDRSSVRLIRSRCRIETDDRNMVTQHLAGEADQVRMVREHQNRTFGAERTNNTLNQNAFSLKYFRRRCGFTPFPNPRCNRNRGEFRVEEPSHATTSRFPQTTREDQGRSRFHHPRFRCPYPAVRAQMFLPPQPGRRQEDLAIDRRCQRLDPGVRPGLGDISPGVTVPR